MAIKDALAAQAGQAHGARERTHGCASALSARWQGIWQTLTTIVRDEGPARLYRGIASPIVAEAPKRAAKFTFNEKFKACSSARVCA